MAQDFNVIGGGDLHIAILYCEECPSYERTFQRVRKVLDEEGLKVKLEIKRVETDDEAERYHFIGSPTILINDRDIDPTPSSIYRAQACRAYKLANGRISPLPSEEMVRKAIRTAIANLKNPR